MGCYGASAAPLSEEQMMEGAAGVWLHPQSTKGTQGPMGPPPPPTALGLFIPTVPLSPPARGKTLGGGTRKWGEGESLGPPIRAAPPSGHILPPTSPHCSCRSAPRDAQGAGGGSNPLLWG